MINILVKNQGVVVGKEVYAGDDDKSRQTVDSIKKDAALTYEEVDQATFDAAQMASVITQEKSEWDGLNTVDEKLDFLASKLGVN